MLLPRVWFPHCLKFLLCVLLACPIQLPTVELDGIGTGLCSTAVAAKLTGLCVRKTDRKAHPAIAWTIAADEVEGPGATDNLRYAPATPLDRPFDLPSLVPAPPDSPQGGRALVVAPSLQSPRLRC